MSFRPEKNIQSRARCESLYQEALDEGCSEFIANILARRVNHFDHPLGHLLKPSLAHLPAPYLLKEATKSAERIAQAVMRQEHIGIVTDYDVDGITSHAVMKCALANFFNVPETHIHGFIGHRLEDGYGVTDGLVDKIFDAQTVPSILMTADCGSSDEPAIARLHASGIDVIVTDHHALPVEGAPASAYATVNPTQEGCDYPDKKIAGCMVAWLVMSQVRIALIQAGYLDKEAPKLSTLLDFVSLGTIADAVSLFSLVNRAVVKMGLSVMNRCQRPCWRAAKRLLGRGGAPFEVDDLGFQIGPRINARGRLADPFAALHFLLAENDDRAYNALSLLDDDNQARKALEKDMVTLAKDEVAPFAEQGDFALVAFHEDFHPGVQGIVASRLVETFGVVVAVLSPTSDEGVLTGSVRSIEGVHVREALQYVDDHQKGVLIGFGGHQGAAGLKLKREALDDFRKAFSDAVHQQVAEQPLPNIYTDGDIAGTFHLGLIEEMVRIGPFGREFEAPVFEGSFEVLACSVVGKRPVHLSLSLSRHDQVIKGIWFNALEAPDDPMPVSVGDDIHAAFRLERNRFRGTDSLQIMVEHAMVAVDL